MTFNPSSSGTENGFPNNREAINHADQVNQLLGANTFTLVEYGTLILASNPTGNGQHFFLTPAPPNALDYSQPFVMPPLETTIGRVVIPLTFTGAAGDLAVSICPDKSGSPDTSNILITTIVPASWIANLGTTGSLVTDTGPLVSVDYNGTSLQNDYSFQWSQPAVGTGGAASFATPVTNGNYMILLGGFNGVTSQASGVVATIPTLGGGFIGNPSLQPAIPQPAYYAMATATNDSIWFAGGTNGSSFYSTVWSANWSPETGVVGAWTAQANLPAPVVQGAATSWNDFIYFVGGSADLTAANAYSTVYYALATNGQVQSWNTTSPLPQALQLMGVSAVAGWLIVSGGQTATGAANTTTYFAKINDLDGSIGTWQTGAELPVGVYATSAQWNYCNSESAVMWFSGYTGSGYTGQFQSLSVTADAISTEWWSQVAGDSGTFQVACFPHGEPGNWQLNVLKTNDYLGADTTVVPRISVPLPLGALTPGNTYHVVIHNMNQTMANYTQLYIGLDAVLSPCVTRAPYSNDAWTLEPNGRSVFIDVYDYTTDTITPLHLWQNYDAGRGNTVRATSTYLWDHLNRLIGYCDSVIMPQNPLNSNTLTTSSTSPWTVHGGTLTASSAQTHGGYAFSGLVTPDGVSSIVYAQSELVPAVGAPNAGYQASSWIYSPPGYPVSISINWFDSGQNYISTSFNTVTVPAATWTYVTNNAVAPNGAAYLTVVPTEGGTPTTSDVFYISYVSVTTFDPTVMSSVAQVNYGTDPWPPTGITQLN